MFSGVLVKYDKLHINSRASNEYVPFIGELMPARWSFEALAVEQFKNNRYEKIFFPYDMEISQNEWYANLLRVEITRNIQACRNAKVINDTVKNNIAKIDFYLRKMADLAGYKFHATLSSLGEGKADSLTLKRAENFLGKLSKEFNRRYLHAVFRKDSVAETLEANMGGKEKLVRLKTGYFNKGLARFVLNEDMTERSVQTPRRIIQKFQPVYMAPTTNYGRAHFCAPFKIVGNLKIDTFWFNLIVIWFVSFLMYLALYFNILRKLVSGFGDNKKRRRDSSFLIIKEISSW